MKTDIHWVDSTLLPVCIRKAVPTQSLLNEASYAVDYFCRLDWSCIFSFILIFFSGLLLNLYITIIIRRI
jgi:hypothetical protein